MSTHHRRLQPSYGHWSDGETSALIAAWGPLHLRRGGRLLRDDWRAAALAVNACGAAAGRRSVRTLPQCRGRIQVLKQLYNKELSKKGPSEWPFFSRLHAFLAGPDGPPPGFLAKKARVKKEEEEEEVVVLNGLLGSWKVPTRPRTGAACCGSSAAAVVAKLAEVYEHVEIERLDFEREKLEMEKTKMEQACKVEK